MDLDKIRSGYFSDAYFNRSKEILERDGHHPVLRLQVFQKVEGACLCGVDEVLKVVRAYLGSALKDVRIFSLNDGDIIASLETVMLFEVDYSLFAPLETIILGILARRTKVATNVYWCTTAARGKEVLFFPARFDHYETQEGDGYAYYIGCRAAGQKKPGGASTDAGGKPWGSKGIGTIPHSMEAAYAGDVADATLKFAEYIDPEVPRVALADYHNDCVGTTLEVAEKMLERYMESDGDPRYRLYGVRLDTSGTMVDKSIVEEMELFEPTGVTSLLVKKVDAALKERAREFDAGHPGRDFFNSIKIIVSGNFNPERIAEFEAQDLPVSAYGVGSSIFNGRFDFTADAVSLCRDGEWVPNSKAGRRYRPNSRMEEVMR